MTPIITNENLCLLLPGKVVAVAKLYAKHNNVSIFDAMRIFYASSTYKNLEKEETKFWHYGPVALYQELMENK